MAWHGMARLGVAGLGLARHGKAFLPTHSPLTEHDTPVTPSTPRTTARTRTRTTTTTTTINDIAPGCLYTTMTVAALFARTGDTVRNWVAAGILPASRLPNCDRLFFLGSDILALWRSLGFDAPPPEPTPITPSQEKKRARAAANKARRIMAEQTAQYEQKRRAASS
jgi:hypothetical protein